MRLAAGQGKRWAGCGSSDQSAPSWFKFNAKPDQLWQLNAGRPWDGPLCLCGSGIWQKEITMANVGMKTGATQQPIVGVFNDKHSAEQAYDVLMNLGYTRDETNVLMTDETRQRNFGEADADESNLGSKALEGAGVGGAIGTVAGGLVAALAAIGTSIALPGLGIVVAGPLAAALAGAGAGAATGGLIGALIGSGIPEEHARKYESHIQKGGILLAVNPRNATDAQQIESSWRQLGNLMSH
jgi:hypothetical protein